MATKIEWTRGDDGSEGETWNPTTGCDKVSSGCDFCYAMTLAKRLKGMGQAKYQRDGNPKTSGPGFGLTLHPDTLKLPLRWKKPRRVFVNSMSDLFHSDVPDEFLTRVWAVMAVTPQHTYQILTKRHGRMRSLVSSPEFRDKVAGMVHIDDGLYSRSLVGWPLPNVWLGVSVEDQKHADLRIPALLGTPATVRFLSCEPLLSAVDLTRIADGFNFVNGSRVPRSRHALQRACDTCDGWGIDCGIDGYHFVNDDCVSWVIVGGESGPGARTCNPEWVSSIIRQCQDANVPVFVKQLGTVWARSAGADNKGGDPSYWPTDLRVREFPVSPDERDERKETLL